MSKLERLLGRIRRQAPHLSEIEISSLERQFIQNIDSVMLSLNQGSGAIFHFNYIEFGHRMDGQRREYFFQETVLKDENGYPVPPYLDIFETEKGRLKHKIKMLTGEKNEVTLNANKKDLEVISGKLDRVVQVFAPKN